MEHRALILSSDVVLRKVKDEVITIHTRTGEFHYFSADSETFLSFFSHPTCLADFYSAAGISVSDDTEGERKYLSDFLSTTLEMGILQNADGQTASVPKVSLESPYRRPQYLRRGKKNLDEVTFAFLYP